MAAANRKTYLWVFLALAGLTALEVAVALPPLGVETFRKGAALVLLAVAKAALVALFFMHLRDERRALKLTVIVPFAFPVLYAVFLVLETRWRLTW